MRRLLTVFLVLVALVVLPALAGAQNGSILPNQANRVSPWQNGSILPE